MGNSTHKSARTLGETTGRHYLTDGAVRIGDLVVHEGRVYFVQRLRNEIGGRPAPLRLISVRDSVAQTSRILPSLADYDLLLAHCADSRSVALLWSQQDETVSWERYTRWLDLFERRRNTVWPEECISATVLDEEIAGTPELTCLKASIETKVATYSRGLKHVVTAFERQYVYDRALAALLRRTVLPIEQ